MYSSAWRVGCVAILCVGLVPTARALVSPGIQHQPEFRPPGASAVNDYPPSDPRKDIAAALADAKKDGKPVLLDFGADWCVDCTVLSKWFRDPAVAAFLRAHFHVVMIDVGNFIRGPEEARNADLAERYGVDPDTSGIPALVLLSARGQVIPSPHHVEWRTARRFSAEDVARYLEQLARRNSR
jgi:thioredoxin 1